jgi:hypothetical protein
MAKDIANLMMEDNYMPSVGPSDQFKITPTSYYLSL